MRLYQRTISIVAFNIEFLDVRNIISDDDSLQDGVLPALREYNLAQFMVVDVPGNQHQVRNTYLILHIDLDGT